MRNVALSLMLGAVLAGPASAVPLTEMRADDLMLLSMDIKTQLKLNANQNTLWSQTEAKARTVLRERVARRERLNSQAREMLSAPAKVELRELAALMDAETTASAAEEKQLREMWLTVNDALDDEQRMLVAKQVTEQMLRQARPEGMGFKPPEGGQHPRPQGQGGGRRGGPGGPGGAGPGG